MRKEPERLGREEIESCRRLLLAKKAEVLAGLGRKFDDHAAMGRVAEDDRAPVFHEEFISLSLNVLDYQLLGLVEEALDRLGAGEYGRCQACGLPIPVKRLQALPWARYCIECEDRVPERESESKLAVKS